MTIPSPVIDGECSEAEGALGEAPMGMKIASAPPRRDRLRVCGDEGLAALGRDGDLLRDPEVEHLGDAVRANHDVLGLDVTVHEPAVVRCSEATRRIG